MTRLAALSDIHGNLPALEAVIADLRAQGCEAVVNLGDILSGPLWPAETADLLMREDWPTIAGNHERQLLTFARERMGESDAFAAARLDERRRRWLAALPPTLAFSEAVFLCHGTPADDLQHFLETVEPDGLREASEAEIAERAGDRRETLIFCGHSHRPGVVTLADGRAVANPGSVGLQAFLDDHPHPYRVENGDPLARYAIVEDGAVTLRQIPYDHRAAGAKARREGREDWAEALLTGHVDRAPC